MLLGITLVGALGLDDSRNRDFRGQAAGALRNGFELKRKLAALPAKGFRLRSGGCDLRAADAGLRDQYPPAALAIA